MKFFALFISRPVATTLLSVAIILAGVLGFRLLPVAPLPQMDIPVIFVTANLPGASPETMAASVATPLERALGRIAGIDEMFSTSSLGRTTIILQFDLNRDINGAARDVQAAINASQTMLPTGMPNPASYFKINPSDAPIVILTLSSESYSQGQLYDYASTQIAPRITKLEGVGQVEIGGGSLPAVRIALNPNALFKQGVSLDAVRAAVSSANERRPQGALDEGNQHWQIQTNSELKQAKDYQPLVIHNKEGAIVRLEDVAQVTDGVENERNAGFSRGKPAVLLVVTRSQNANIIETVDRIKAELPAMQQAIPTSLDLSLMQDRSPTIRASLHEVGRALTIAVILVIGVVFCFLRSWRATLIPTIAIPISLIGTFAAMHLCGFSLNNFSLMALTIATGFVVDDAIVVLENISRYLEKGESSKRAALLGIQEVGFTILSMTLSLIAVFIPLQLIDPMLGRLFREFTVTLSVSIIISLFVSMTLTPMMCAYLLKSKKIGIKPRSKMSVLEKVGNIITQNYSHSLHWAIKHSRWILLLFVGVFLLNFYLYIAIPKTFFPEQDTGRLMGTIRADQSTSFPAMQQKLKNFMAVVQQDPAVDTVAGFTRKSNSGSMFIGLKPLSSRSPEDSAQRVVARLSKALSDQPGAQLFLRAVQDINSGSGGNSNASYQFSLLSDDATDLRIWEPRIRRALTQLPQLADVNSDKEDKGAEIALTYNRDVMARLGISVMQVNSLLNNAFGQRQISTIYEPLNQYKVVMEVDKQYSQDVTALEKMFVINAQGEAIPLSTFASWQPANAPIAIQHQGLSASSSISFNLAVDVPLSEAVSAINKTMMLLGVPDTVRGEFAGTAQQFEKAQHSQLIMMLAAIAMIYIVLGILYESYIHPLTILSTLPSAGIGALLGLMLFDTPFSIIALIGIMLLMGIVKKNAIMMVDFALTAEKAGLTPQQAIHQAAMLRFRPIMMTTLAAILSALPLMLTSGDGAEMRQPLGITIVGGLVVSQILTLYTTPAIYLFFDKQRQRGKRLKANGFYVPALIRLFTFK